MSAALLTVYTRRGCHLCDDLIEALLPLVRGRADVSFIDIDDDPLLVERYNDAVPVLVHGEQEICRHFLDRDALTLALQAING
ncbi:MAG: glutaredoxin family protein [Pseudomonadota bacterium]